MNTLAPEILIDEKYLECIRLATNSKSEQERYGSLAIKDGKIIGKGYNKRVDPKENDPRIKNMGYANHAEFNAISDAIRNDIDISGADIYVAGLLLVNKEWRLFLKEEPAFTCVKCAKNFIKYGIASVVVPTPTGWQTLSTHQAYIISQEYNPQISKKYDNSLFDELIINKSVNERRKDAIAGTYTLEDIAESLMMK